MFMTSSPIWFYSRPYTPNIRNNIRHLNHNDSSGKFQYRVALPDEGQVETYHVCKNEEAMLKGRTKNEGNGDVRTLKRKLTPITVTFFILETVVCLSIPCIIEKVGESLSLLRLCNARFD